MDGIQTAEQKEFVIITDGSHFTFSVSHVTLSQKH